ncbi:MAG: glycosyltransferase [Nanoarchaeota archaeon]
MKKYHHDIHIIRRDFEEEPLRDKNIKLHKIKKPWSDSDNIFLRLIGILYLEIYSIFLFSKLFSKVDYFYFLQSTQLFLPGLFFLKITDKDIIKITTRDYTKRRVIPLIRLIYSLSDIIVVFTDMMIKRLGIEDKIEKVFIWNYNYVHSKFTSERDIDERKYIGYIGRLAPEKNIENLISTAKKLGLRNNLIIAGGGQSFDEIKNICEKEGVEFVGKLSHYAVPDYMNKLKILVLPSDTEGFPKIITEAMACGTLVLCTDVGGISDVVKDGNNGFLLSSTSVESIRKGLERVLNIDDLDDISKRAIDTINTKFSYSNAVDGYEELLKKLNRHDL